MCPSGANISMKVSAPRIRQRVLRGGRLLIIWCFIGLAIVLLLLGPGRLAYAFLAWFWS